MTKIVFGNGFWKSVKILKKILQKSFWYRKGGDFKSNFRWCQLNNYKNSILQTLENLPHILKKFTECRKKTSRRGARAAAPRPTKASSRTPHGTRHAACFGGDGGGTSAPGGAAPLPTRAAVSLAGQPLDSAAGLSSGVACIVSSMMSFCQGSLLALER